MFCLSEGTNETMHFYPTQLCDAFVELQTKFASSGMSSFEENELAMFERLKYYFKRAFSLFQLHLILCRGSRKEKGHFTLLSLRGTKEGELRIVYYDGLNNPWPENKKTAEILFKIATENSKHSAMKMPEAQNVFKQVSDQCGLFSMHYIEEEVRNCLGQGIATQGYPDQMRLIGANNKNQAKGLYERLKTLCEHLEKERRRWVREVEEKENQEKVALDDAAAKYEEAQETAETFKTLQEELQHAALSALEDKDGSQLIYAEDFGIYFLTFSRTHVF